MWETIKSIAFVITTVMIALILQARASPIESMDSSTHDQVEAQLQQLDFSSSLPSTLKTHP
jgi:hypothetical protein